MSDKDKPIDELANEYAKSVGDDCLCSRTLPGTPVGECIYIFCGCDIAKAFKAGFEQSRAEIEELETKYCNVSMIVMRMWAMSRRDDKSKACDAIFKLYHKSKHLLERGTPLKACKADEEIDSANKRIAELEKDNELILKANALLAEESKKLEKVLKYCKGQTNFMWAATVVGIILDCDFRDAEKALAELEAE